MVIGGSNLLFLLDNICIFGRVLFKHSHSIWEGNLLGLDLGKQKMISVKSLGRFSGVCLDIHNIYVG